jgi:hypothetical protein
VWSLGEFVERVLWCRHRYEAEHAWFHWGDPSTYVFSAWRMYRCASQSALGFLLLGDTKIRKDPTLVMNFGLASAHGVQDAEELKMIGELLARRQGLAGIRSGPATPVLGPGAILSDRNWTPLLNDSFLLGGIHRGWDFHLAEEGFDQFNFLGPQEFLRRREAFGPAAPQYAAALARGPEYYQQKWKHYLVGHPDAIWKGGIPRVFARELIGLKTFGYVPRFTSSELGFCCQNFGAARTADFERYLNALGAVGLNQNNRVGVLSSIAEFLFGTAEALAGPGNQRLVS